MACLERAAAIGFAGVQIDPMHLPDHKPAVLQRIRDVADELSLFLEAGIIGIDKYEILDGLRICRAFASPFFARLSALIAFRGRRISRHACKRQQRLCRPLCQRCRTRAWCWPSKTTAM